MSYRLANNHLCSCIVSWHQGLPPAPGSHVTSANGIYLKFAFSFFLRHWRNIYDPWRLLVEIWAEDRLFWNESCLWGQISLKCSIRYHYLIQDRPTMLNRLTFPPRDYEGLFSMLIFLLSIIGHYFLVYHFQRQVKTTLLEAQVECVLQAGKV